MQAADGAACPCARAGRFTALVAPLLLSACQGDLSALAPAGPAARDVAQAWWLMAAGAVLILLAVCALAAYAVWGRVVWRRAGPIGEQGGRRLILWAGVVLPLVVLLALLAYGLQLGHGLLPGAWRGDPYRVQVTARQWQWDVRYPDAAGGARRSVDVLHIPAGRPVEIQVTAVDVIHGFWVPRLGGKIDAIPGRLNTVRWQADEAGEYLGVCAEFCGSGHTNMVLRVQAHAAPALAAQLAALARDESPGAPRGAP